MNNKINIELKKDDHRTEGFFALIEDFFDSHSPSNIIEGNNNLINSYLNENLKKGEGHNDFYLKETIWRANEVMCFLVGLQERWNAFKRVNNVDIEL